MINLKSEKGIILVNVLIFAVIAIIVTLALINWAAATLKGSRQLASREQAFQVAEAGVDYYRWHLAHAQSDYTDGNDPSSTGPYTHDFKDKNGNTIGQFALTITPPPIGSTVVKIRSKGTVLSDPGVSRTIEATLAIPSLARYAVAANDVMRFGAGTEIFGPIHSNDGIRFDGLAHNVISSSKATYNDPDDGSSQHKFGVYTTISPTDPNPPASVPNRPDVFVAGRQFPVPAIDFVGLTTNLSQMKSDAIDNGRYFASSGSQGYQVILKTNDTFDIYRVTSLNSVSNSCENSNFNQEGWGSWSIKNKTFLANYSLPANGIIFVEDHVWVEGQINTARVTIAAGKFPDSPTNRRSITVNNDLLYTNYDGSDNIALVSQGNINVGLSSEDDLRIDAALVAQNGRVGRYYYSSNCGSSYRRDIITLYGMIASNKRYGFAYTDGTGYELRKIIYDSNLLYSPPPSFPLTSSQYTTISWDEVK